jgi:hypothetical protein
MGVDRASDLRAANLLNFDGSENLYLFLDRPLENLDNWYGTRDLRNYWNWR